MTRLLMTVINDTGRELKIGELVYFHKEDDRFVIRDYTYGKNFAVVEEIYENSDVVIIAWQGDTYFRADKDYNYGDLAVAFPIETKSCYFQRQLYIYDNCKKGDLVPISIRTVDVSEDMNV